MFTTMHWLPNRRAAWRTNSGLRQAAELIETLSLPAFEQGADVVEGADAAADGQRHEHHFGRAADHVEDDVAALVAGRDVEEDQLVGPFLLVARGHLDRIAGVAEVEEIRSLDDPAPVHVEAGNHPFGEHRRRPQNWRTQGESTPGKAQGPRSVPTSYCNRPDGERSTPHPAG